MKFNKPKFWRTKYNFFSILLMPISIVYFFLLIIKKKLTKQSNFNIPIVCIGNIYLGGTGKTPTSIFLANEISKLGKKTVILRKYYKDQVDEYNLIKSKFKNLIVTKNRQEGIIEAEKQKYDIVILDDGYQDFKIKKDLNIICFNTNQLDGNGLFLPSGPLRESLNSLKEANIVLINGEKNLEFEKKILNINKDLKIFSSYYRATNVDQFKNKDLVAIAGIGNPENFKKILEEYDLNIKDYLTFPDHYEFSKEEFEKIVQNVKNKNYQIITTEKDFYKVKEFDIKDVNYLKLSLEIEKKEEFMKLINEVYAKKD